METARCIVVSPDRWAHVAERETEGFHPADILVLGLEGKAVPITGVRLAQRFVAETPVGERRKVLLAGVDLLSLPAANALLKLIEEPPEYADIVLLAQAERILPTIRSRVILSVESSQNDYIDAIRKMEKDPAAAHRATYLLPLLHTTIAKSVVLDGIFHTTQ